MEKVFIILHLKICFIFTYMLTCTWVGMGMCTWVQVPMGTRAVGSPEVSVIGSCKLLDLDARNYLILTAESFLQLLYFVLILLVSFLCCDRQHDQKQLRGGKGLFDFCFWVTVHHWRESGQELKQELNQKPWRNTACWLASWPVKASFLTQPRLPA